MAKKHELIKQAYDRYPKGTRFRIMGAIAECISEGSFSIDAFDSIYMNDRNGTYVYQSGQWAEIIPSEPEKKSILDGKVVIQVNDDREFKLLMKHYEEKGWKWISGHEPTKMNPHVPYPYQLLYGDNITWSGMYTNEFKSISFSDFAAEVGIEVPKKLLTSVDGVDMYEGDEASFVGMELSGKWSWIADNTLSQSRVEAIKNAKATKVFSTKESALAWIEEQKKPKEVIVSANGKYPVAVKKDGATIKFLGYVSRDSIVLNGKELEEIYSAYQSLNRLP